MKSFEFEIPELKSLNEAEREKVVKKCQQSPKLMKYRAYAPRIVGPLIGLVPTAFLLYSLLVLEWKYVNAILVFLGLTIFMIISLLALKLFGELRLLKRLILQEISKL